VILSNPPDHCTLDSMEQLVRLAIVCMSKEDQCYQTVIVLCL